jgi:hypothetical protein
LDIIAKCIPSKRQEILKILSATAKKVRKFLPCHAGAIRQ